MHATTQEPNGGTWLPHTTPAGMQFAELVNVVGDAVIAAGLRDELLVGPATAGVDLPFIETLGKMGALQYLDGVSVHPYRNGGPESALGDWKQLDDLLNRYSHNSSGKQAHRPSLISGEWGWPSCSNASGAAVPCIGGDGSREPIPEEVQAARLVRQRYVNDLAGVALSIWYDWVDDNTNRSLAESNYGTVHNSQGSIGGAGVPKPAYRAALASTALLGNCSLVGRLETTVATSFALSYRCSDDELLVVAWDPAAELSTVPIKPTVLTLPASEIGSCFELLDMYGSSSCPAPPYCEPPPPRCARGRAVAVELTGQPQYLVLKRPWLA